MIGASFSRMGCTVALTALPALSLPADLAESLDQIIDESPVSDRTIVALKLVDLDSGELLYDRHGGWLMTPASNLKIYTSSAALDEFGSDHRFSTEIGIDGFLTDETLAGRLVLRGGGDPMLDTDALLDMARRVSTELEIGHIKGDIVVDESLFARPLKGPGWMWDDDPDTYNMSVSSIMMDFNVLVAEVAPSGDGERARITLSPPSDYPPIVNNTRTVSNGESTIRVTRTPFEDVIRVSGNIAANDSPTTTALTMHHPAKWIGHVFRQMLLKEGVEVEGDVLTTTVPTNVRASLVHEGQTLGEAITHFNKTSENAVGEMLIHDIAVNRSHVPATWPAGAEVVSDWLVDTAGLEAGSFRYVDGSGLSRYNLINADSSIRLLQFMREHEEKSVFFQSLPIYEVELTDGSKKFLVHAKPGGMTGVSTLSGYIQNLEGKWLAFSFLTNGYLGSNEPIRELRGELFRMIVEWKED